MLYPVLFVYEWCLKTDTKRLAKIFKASLLSHLILQKSSTHSLIVFMSVYHKSILWVEYFFSYLKCFRFALIYTENNPFPSIERGLCFEANFR